MEGIWGLLGMTTRTGVMSDDLDGALRVTALDQGATVHLSPKYLDLVPSQEVDTHINQRFVLSDSVS